MKKFVIFFISAILMLTMYNSTKAEGNNYYYGFFLSCGEIHYESFSYELDEDGLIFWTEIYDAIYCGDNAPGEGTLQ